jgi:hypothetical protein
MKTQLRILAIMTGFVICSSGMTPSNYEKQCVSGRDAFQVKITVIHKVGNELLEFDTLRYQNSSGNKYSVYTLRYFLSGISLTKNTGETVLLKEVQYVDGRIIKTNSFLSGDLVPAGEYLFLTFQFGLNDQFNVSGRFPNHPENRMEWPETMGGGYHYMKLEGKIESTAEDLNFQAHTGRLNETSHFIRISLPVKGLKVDHDGVSIQLIMDINQWWEQPNKLDLNDISAIMDNYQIQKQLMENGRNVFSTGAIE